MKRVITLLTALLLMNWSVNAWAFTCKTPLSTLGFGGGNGDVTVNILPTINPEENVVIDLSTQISCGNDSSDQNWEDYITLESVTVSNTLLSDFLGTVNFNGQSRRIPFDGDMPPFTIKVAKDPLNGFQVIYFPIPVSMIITPKKGVSGAHINIGDTIAILYFKQSNNQGYEPTTYSWTIKASNEVVIPTGTCDVTDYNTVVTLDDYSGLTRDVNIPLSVKCSQELPLKFYLSGTTVSGNDSIFTNIAQNGAKNVGVQLKHKGIALSSGSNQEVSLGNVGSKFQDLELTANYAFPAGGSFTAGEVKSIIGVVFVYE